MLKPLLNLAFITAAILLPLATWTRHWTLALIAAPIVLITWYLITRGRANENQQQTGPQIPLDTPPPAADTDWLPTGHPGHHHDDAL